MENLLFVTKNNLLVENNIITKETRRTLGYLNYKIVHSSSELVIFGDNQTLIIWTYHDRYQIWYPFKLNLKTLCVVDNHIVVRNSHHNISIYNLQTKKMIVETYSISYNQILKLDNGIIAAMIGYFTSVDNPEQMNEKCLIFKSITDCFNKLCGKCIEYKTLFLSTFSFLISRDSMIVEFEFGIDNKNHFVRIFNTNFQFKCEIEVEPYQIELKRNRVAILDGRIYLWDLYRILVIDNMLEYSIDNEFSVEEYNSHYGVWIDASLNAYKIENCRLIKVDLSRNAKK